MSDQAQPQQLVIPLATAEAVVNYLAARPYVEVFQLIAAMQQLQPLPAPEPVPAPVKE